jgi:hypothetical protein
VLPKMETSILMMRFADARGRSTEKSLLPVTVYRYRLPVLLLLLLFNTTRTFRTPKHEVWTAVQFTNSRKENVG